MPEEKIGKARIHRPVGWKCDDDDDVMKNTPSCLPSWHGDISKDVVTSEQWIERIQGAKDICRWSDDLTMFKIFNALKGEALTWYVIFKRSKIGSITWSDFKAAFVKKFGSEKNLQAIIKFSELKQCPQEKVADFYNRVMKAVDDLESLVPNGYFELPDPTYPRALTNIPGFAKLNAKYKRIAAHRLVRHGASSAFNFVGLNIFLSGVRTPVQQELLKFRPKTLNSALMDAQAFEKVIAEKKSKKASVPLPPKPMSNLNTVYYEAVEPVDEMEYEEPVEDNDPKEDDDQSDEQPCDNDDCFSDDSTNPQKMHEDIGLDDDELVRLSTKKLNELLKMRKIDKERQKELKYRRRTLKNRTYAASCRNRHDETEESVRKEILDLNVKVAERVIRNENCRKESKAMISHLKSVGMGDDMINIICSSNHNDVEKVVREFSINLESSQSFI